MIDDTHKYMQKKFKNTEEENNKKENTKIASIRIFSECFVMSGKKWSCKSKFIWQAENLNFSLRALTEVWSIPRVSWYIYNAFLGLALFTLLMLSKVKPGYFSNFEALCFYYIAVLAQELLKQRYNSLLFNNVRLLNLSHTGQI